MTIKSKTLLALTLSTFLLGTAALPVFAQEPPPGEPPAQGAPHDGPPPKDGPNGRGGKMFEESDTNKDGELTRAEMMSAHEKRLDKMFTELDTDKSNTLNKAELDKGREKMRARFQEHMKDRKAKRGDKTTDGAKTE